MHAPEGGAVLDVNLGQALRIIEAGRKKAGEMCVPMVLAVVDGGGNLVAQQRMDGALLASVDISLNKAFTAVTLKMPTHQLAELSGPGQPLYGINATNQGRMVIFGGGFPLRSGDAIIGGLGVSGGSVEEDIEVARAALA